MIFLESNLLSNKFSAFQNISVQELKIHVLSILLLISFLPWFVWKIYPIVLLFLFILYLLISIRKLVIRNKFSLLILFVFIYFSLIRIDQNFNGWLITNISIINLFLISNENQKVRKGVFDNFVKIFSLLLIPGIVIHIASNFFTIPSIGLIDGRSVSAEKFENYIFYIKDINPFYKIFPRFNSVFDEPGVIGNISLFILWFLNFDISRWFSKITLLAGLLSFSLFFYIGAFLFIFIKYARRIKYLIIFGLFLTIFYTTTREIEILNTYIYKRIEFKSNYDIVGNTRTTPQWDSFYEKFERSHSYFIGVLGLEKNFSNDFEWFASYQGFIYLYGIFGLILICSYYFITIKAELDIKNTIVVMLLFIVAIYQRPFIFEFNYYSLIFFCGIASLKAKACKIVK